MSSNQSSQGVVGRLASALDATLLVVSHEITTGDQLRIAGADKKAVKDYYLAATEQLIKAEQLLAITTSVRLPKTQQIHDELAQIKKLLSSEPFTQQSRAKDASSETFNNAALLLRELLPLQSQNAVAAPSVAVG